MKLGYGRFFTSTGIMKKYQEKLLQFVVPKVKFASTSLLATVVDYTLYLTLVYTGFEKVPSNIVSASCGFLINFLLQKRFIFTLKRRLRTAFFMSMSFSAFGIAISTGLIFLFNKNQFLDQHQYITKMIVMGIMFFYNFYTKRIAFEKNIH